MNPTSAVTKAPRSSFDIARAFLMEPAMENQIRLALPKHCTPDRMLRAALTSVLNSPKLGECFLTQVGKASVAQSMLKASQLGLEVDGRQGHLVPFNSKEGMKCQFIPGYQGLLDLAYNHPKVKSIWAEAVYEKDRFIECKGSERKLIHEPYEGDDDAGQLVRSYAVAELDNGSKTWVTMRPRDIDRRMKSSRSATSEYSPWVTNKEAMWKKSAILQLCKFIPQSTQLRDAITVDDEEERVSVSGPTFDGGMERETPIRRARVQAPEPAAALEAPAGQGPGPSPEPDDGSGLGPVTTAAPVELNRDGSAPIVTEPTQTTPAASADPLEDKPYMTLMVLLKRDNIEEEAVMEYCRANKLAKPTQAELAQLASAKLAQLVHAWPTIAAKIKATPAT